MIDKGNYKRIFKKILIIFQKIRMFSTPVNLGSFSNLALVNVTFLRIFSYNKKRRMLWPVQKLTIGAYQVENP